jgi:hypothetical protein
MTVYSTDTPFPVIGMPLGATATFSMQLYYPLFGMYVGQTNLYRPNPFNPVSLTLIAVGSATPFPNPISLIPAQWNVPDGVQ